MDHIAKAAWDLLFQDAGSEEETFVSYDDFTVEQRAMGMHTSNGHRKYSNEFYHDPIPLEKVDEYTESRALEDYEYKRQPKTAYKRLDTDEYPEKHGSKYVEDAYSERQLHLKGDPSFETSSTRSSKSWLLKSGRRPKYESSAHKKQMHSGHAESRTHDRSHKSHSHAYDRRHPQRLSDETSHATGRSKFSRKSRSKASTRDKVELERERRNVRSSHRYDDYKYDMEPRESIVSLSVQPPSHTTSHSKHRSSRSLMEQAPPERKREHRGTGRSSRRFNDLEYIEESRDTPLKHGHKSKSTVRTNSCTCPHCGTPSIKSSKRDLFAAVARSPSAKGIVVFGKR